MAEAAGVKRMILPGMKKLGDSAQPMAVAAADSQALVPVEQPQTSPNNGVSSLFYDVFRIINPKNYVSLFGCGVFFTNYCVISFTG